jgi:CDP-diacylglycerol pyrophosphatase
MLPYTCQRLSLLALAMIVVIVLHACRAEIYQMQVNKTFNALFKAVMSDAAPINLTKNNHAPKFIPDSIIVPRPDPLDGFCKSV